MHDAANQPTAPPPGHKLLAWEGVGLFVPQSWDIARYHGDHDRGVFRVASPTRAVIDVEWWSERKPISIDRLIEQYSKRIQNDRRVSNAITLTRANELAEADAPFQVFASQRPDASPESPREVLAVWRHTAANRVGVWRFTIHDDGPSDAALRDMLRSLRLQPADAWRDWAAFDFALQSPPGFTLDEASLGCGVCLLRFSHRHQQIALRRFTAVSATIVAAGDPADALQRLCRAIYAPEFHDMRYTVEPRPSPDNRMSLILRGRRRLAAAEWLPPLARHRKSPAEIRVTWDRDADKIHAVECRKPSNEDPIVSAFESSIRMTLTPPFAPEARGELDAIIRPNPGVTTSVNPAGRAVLHYERRRPAPLRALRVLAAQPAGAASPATLELDAIGSLVWQLCDGQHTVGDVVNQLTRRFKISYREAQLSATTYLKQLTDRGLLSIEPPAAPTPPGELPGAGDSESNLIQA